MTPTTHTSWCAAHEHGACVVSVDEVEMWAEPGGPVRIDLDVIESVCRRTTSRVVWGMA